MKMDQSNVPMVAITALGLALMTLQKGKGALISEHDFFINWLNVSQCDNFDLDFYVSSFFSNNISKLPRPNNQSMEM